jgi:hypothetical protein
MSPAYGRFCADPRGIKSFPPSLSEAGYSITALRACPDRYCASFRRRLLIFGMTANGATVAKICPAELAVVGSHFGVRNPIELNGINDLSLATSIENIH